MSNLRTSLSSGPGPVHTFLQNSLPVLVKPWTPGTGRFVVVTFFAQLPPKKHPKNVWNLCHPRFIALLLRVPCTPVLQTTASVMPERSKPPNLALKRNATALVSPMSHIFKRKSMFFYVDRSTTTMPNQWVSILVTFTMEIVHLLNAYESC